MFREREHFNMISAYSLIVISRKKIQSKHSKYWEKLVTFSVCFCTSEYVVKQTDSEFTTQWLGKISVSVGQLSTWNAR